MQQHLRLERAPLAETTAVLSSVELRYKNHVSRRDHECVGER